MAKNKKHCIMNGPATVTVQLPLAGCDKKFWQIFNKADGVAEILIYEQIGVDWWTNEGISPKQFAEDLKTLGDIKSIVLRINSPGGNVYDGLAIYNQLCAHPATKDVYIDGIAASIASVIAMCGTVHMPENAMLMIHDPWNMVCGSADDMRKQADLLDKVKANLISAYRAKTGLADQEISDLMSAETWLLPADAKEKGFCDEVLEPVKIAAQFDLTSFKNTPSAIKGAVLPNTTNPQDPSASHPGEPHVKTNEVAKIPAPPASAKTEPVKPEEVIPMKCNICGGALDEHGVCAACAAAKAQAQAAAQARVSEILALGQKHGQLDLAMDHINKGNTIDEFRAALLEAKPAAQPLDVKVDNLAAEKPFARFGEQLMAVANAAKNPRAVDKRLLHINNAALGSSEAVPADGGFLVQTDFTTELLNNVNQTGIVLPKCKRIPIGAGSNGLRAPMVDETSRATGSRWGGIQIYRDNEAAGVTASGPPKFGMFELRLEKLMGILYSTDELLADASALGAIISQAFTEEFGFRIDSEIIAGTGAGQMLGVTKAPCLIKVDKEAGQEASTVVAENIINMFARMSPRSVAKAEWQINQELWPQIFSLRMEIGTGGVPMYLPPGGLVQSPFGLLLGRPINVLEQCEAPGTVGDILFADFSQYGVIEKDGLVATQSIHVQFLTDQTAFKFVLRNNGQPIPKKALTPYKGTKTTSPFVALAARA